MPDTRAAKRMRMSEALAEPVIQTGADDLASLTELVIKIAPDSDELEPTIAVDELDLIDEATAIMLSPAVSLIQRLRHHLLRARSQTLLSMLLVALDVYLQVPIDERLHPDEPTKDDIRRIIREDFPTLVLHRCDSGVSQLGSWGLMYTQQPKVLHIWEPLLLACGDIELGHEVTSRQMQVLAVITVLHELTHSITHRLCTSSSTPIGSALVHGEKSGELGHSVEMQVVGGLLGVTWGEEAWGLPTARAMTASVPDGSGLRKVRVTTEWCTQFVDALDTDTLPTFASAKLESWRDPRGSVCSRVNQSALVEEAGRSKSPVPEDTWMGLDRCGRQ